MKNKARMNITALKYNCEHNHTNAYIARIAVDTGFKNAIVCARCALMKELDSRIEGSQRSV